MQRAGSGDIHPAEIRAHLAAKIGGVFQRLFAGGKAGHGDGDDILRRQPQRVKGRARHQQCQRTVQAAADTDDRLLAADAQHALAQAARLQLQDIQTALLAGAALGGRHKGRGRYLGGKTIGRQREGGLAIAYSAGGGKALHAQPVGGQHGKIDGRRRIRAFIRQPRVRFGQHPAVLDNQPVAAEHQIAAAFARAAGGVSIGAYAARRQHGQHVPPIFRFGHDIIAGR